MGLKTVSGHFYIRYIKSYTEKPSWMDQYVTRPVTDVSIKNTDWVSFTDRNHPDSDLYDGDDGGPKAVVMASVDNGGGWMLAFEDELVDTVCVYNIKPDEACSKCRDEKFCRFAGSERQETECVCQKTNEGEHCEVDLCSHCQNGGFCEINYPFPNPSTKEIQCQCPYPFYGENCESSSILLVSGPSSMLINSLG